MAAMEFFAWLTFLICLILILTKQIKMRNLQEGVFLWGLVAVVVLGMYINVSPEVREHSEILGRMRWVLTFYSTVYALDAFNINLKFIKFLNYLVGIIAIYAIVQAFTGVEIFRKEHIIFYANESKSFFRSTGMFSMPTTFAHSIGMYFFFPFAYFFLDKNKPIKLKLPFLLAAVFVFAAVITSLTRGAYIGLFAGIVGTTFLIKKRFTAIAVILTFMLGGILYYSSDVFKERAAFSLANQKSMKGRINLWKANWQMFKDYPVLGIGYTINEPAAKDYFNKMGIKQDLIAHAHNNFLNFLSSTGTLGFLFYTGFVFYFLILTFKLWKSLPQDQILLRSIVLGALGAQIYFHVCGLTDCPFTDMEVNHQFLFVLALVSSLAYKNNVKVFRTCPHLSGRNEK